MHKLAPIAAIAAAVVAAPATAAPTFILNDIGGVGAGTQARAGFETAAALWASRFTDNITIRLDVGFQQLGSGILGSTGSTRSDVSYSSVRSALTSNRTSANDNSAVASLGTTLSFRSNERGNCTTGQGCRNINANSRTLDNDNTRDNNFLSANTANQKAIGLRSDNGSRDGSITFSTAFDFDFDSSDGISPGAFDFVGVAAHEIGHALGFVSGVDLADGNIGRRGLDSIAWGSIHDLFRYTGTQRDWTVGGTPCTSVNGGQSCVGLMSTGRAAGDGQQASHWKDNLGIGILDPTAGQGEFLSISTADLIAFDIMGYELASGFGPIGSLVAWGVNSTPTGDVYYDEDNVVVFQLVPSPAALALFGVGLLALAIGRRVRR